MPKPYEFSSSIKLISRLRGDREKLRRMFQKGRPDPNLVLLVRTSVGRSTFRGLRTKKRGPAAVFREWAYERLGEPNTIEELRAIKSHKEYDQWLQNLSNDFRSHWKVNAELQIAFGPGRKLPDLLMKKVVWWDGFGAAERKRLIGFLHVPLDSFSLIAVRRCVAETEVCQNVEVPKNAAMGWVESERVYNALQQAMRELANRAGVPPIYIDVLAWNVAHKAVERGAAADEPRN